MRANQRVPITIIGGFLGAGKTSLLSHILKSDHGKRMAVLVNDFGQLNIDAEQIVEIEGETISLTNGCICCTIRDDLMNEVLNLLTKSVVPEHIIIETSGVSDPTLVAHTFQMPAMQGIVEVDSLISVVDADNILSMDKQVQDLITKQVRVADLIVVNKVDLAGLHQEQEVLAYINRLAPKSRIIKAMHGVVPLHLMLGTSRFTPEGLIYSRQDHIPEFDTWTYTNKLPFTFMSIRKAVEGMPTNVYRAKGFFQLEGALAEQGLFQMTGGRSWLRMGTSWGNNTRMTRLVFIGKDIDENRESICKFLDECQTNYCRTAIDARSEPIVIDDLRALSVLFG